MNWYERYFEVTYFVDCKNLSPYERATLFAKLVAIDGVDDYDIVIDEDAYGFDENKVWYYDVDTFQIHGIYNYLMTDEIEKTLGYFGVDYDISAR